MAVTFPPNPVIGDTFTTPTGLEYEWRGDRWVALGGGTGGGGGSTAPALPAVLLNPAGGTSQVVKSARAADTPLTLRSSSLATSPVFKIENPDTPDPLVFSVMPDGEVNVSGEIALNSPGESTCRVHGRGTAARLSLTAHESWNLTDGGFMSLYGKDHPGYSGRGVYIRAEPDSGGIELVGDVKITGTSGSLQVERYGIGVLSNGTPNAAYISCAETANNAFAFQGGVASAGGVVATFRSSMAAGNNQVARVDDSTAPLAATSVLTRVMGDARYASISAKRFKDGITEAAKDSGAVIDQLAVKEWKWGGATDPRDERYGQPGVGLIAEDVDAVLPEAVLRRRASAEVADPEGGTQLVDTDDLEILGLDPLVLIGVLVTEVKEMRARLAALEKTRATPEKKVSTRSRKSSSP